MQPKLTILNHTFYPDLPGGVEWCMWHTARAFASRGVSVRVLTERRPGLAALEMISPNLTINRFEAMPASVFTRWHDARQTMRIRWWANVLRQAKPSGPLWCNGYPMTTLGALLAGRTQDVIFNPSTCVAATNRVARLYADQSQSALSKYFEQLDRLAYRAAPRVLVSSENIREQLANHYGVRGGVSVTPFGTDPSKVRAEIDWNKRDAKRRAARLKLGIPGDADLVGFVGRLDYCKDLPFLLRGVAHAMSLGANNLRLLAVGDGDRRAAFEEIARTLGVADRVHWTGMLSDTSAAYDAMDLLAVPSVYETFGYVIIEAMAAGLPVVGRRRVSQGKRPVLTANEELIRHGVDGLLVAPHDPCNLGNQLRGLFDDSTVLRRMSEEAAKRAAARTWDHYVNDLMPMLEPHARSVEPVVIARAA